MYWHFVKIPEVVGGNNNASLKIYRIVNTNAFSLIKQPDAGQWQVGYIIDPTGTTLITDWVTVDNWEGQTWAGLDDNPLGHAYRGYRIGIRPLGSSGQGMWFNDIQLQFEDNTYGLKSSAIEYVEGEGGIYGMSAYNPDFEFWTDVSPTDYRCVQSGGANTGIKEVKQFLNVLESDNYGQIRWEDRGEDLTLCALPPDPTPNWQDTVNRRCVQANGANTGEQEKEQQDINEASPSYNQLRWVTNGQNIVACPIPQQVNTGYKGWATLEEYFVDTGVATGNETPNIEAHPNYVPPVLDPNTCPLP